MNKNVFISGIGGTIIYYLLGWFVYGFLFPEMTTGDESPLGIFLGCLFYVFIYAVIFVRWANITDFKSGFMAGLLLGLLYALSWQSFAYEGYFEMNDFIKEVLIGALTSAIGAGAVGFIYGKIS